MQRFIHLVRYLDFYLLLKLPVINLDIPHKNLYFFNAITDMQIVSFRNIKLKYKIDIEVQKTQKTKMNKLDYRISSFLCAHLA